MKLSQFKEKLDNKEITDYDKYLAPSYSSSFRAELISRGILVNESLELNEVDPILEAISTREIRRMEKLSTCIR